VYDVPIATNEGTAEVLLRALGEGLLDFRAVYRGRAHGDGNEFCRRCVEILVLPDQTTAEDLSGS